MPMYDRDEYYHEEYSPPSVLVAQSFKPRLGHGEQRTIVTSSLLQQGHTVRVPEKGTIALYTVITCEMLPTAVYELMPPSTITLKPATLYRAHLGFRRESK
jgi:hypothetical protein